MPSFSFIVIIPTVVEFLSRNSPITKSQSIVGFEPNGFVVISYGPVEIAFLCIGISAAIKGGGVLRVETYRLAEVCDRFIKAASRVSRVTFFNRV
jgi:hypothetical protein